VLLKSAPEPTPCAVAGGVVTEHIFTDGRVFSASGVQERKTPNSVLKLPGGLFAERSNPTAVFSWPLVLAKSAC